MKLPSYVGRCRIVRFAAILCVGGAISAQAQVIGTGSIEGRVFNPATGEYLELARITVEGTMLEALTDASGQYRLTNVPAGPARVRAFRTGVVSQTQSITVAAGQTVPLNFDLSGFQAVPSGDGTVKLDAFVVGASKEMDGSAIAINTQRFAPNVMNVVSADEYVAMTEGGIGELLKAVPGMAVNIGGGGEPYLLSMNGVPPSAVPVSINGFSVANATAGTSRQVGIEQLSMNNVSRIEVAFTPTPETSGSALAGTVNLVPRSAFERSKPVVNVTGYLALRDSDRHFGDTPGPNRDSTPKVRPGVDFSAIVPVNSWFGFTVSASRSSVYTVGDFMQMTWRGTGSATNGTTLPDTTPDKPYLTDIGIGDQPKLTKRNSFGATFDFKLTRNDRVSLSFMRGFIDFYSNGRTLNFFVNRVAPGDFSPTATHGSGGAGEIRLTNGIGIFGGRVYMPTLTYVHSGPVWKAEAGAGHSHSTRHNLNVDDGFFSNVQARRQNVNIAYDDIFYLRPGTITVTDAATGAKVDPYAISSYTLNTSNGSALKAADLQRSAYANLRREFSGRWPLVLKAGVDVKQVVRDTRTDSPSDNGPFTFVGADGRAGTADDAAAVVRDDSFSQRIPPYGFPKIDWVSNGRLWDLWKAQPQYFSLNSVTRYTQAVAASKHAEEVISAAYVRGDLQFFEGRLKLVGGVRAEQTNVRGEGQLVDATLNYQRDARGKVVLAANSRPALIAPAGTLEAARLTTIDRGLHAEKEYLRLFPSLNASYSLRENLIARAGYYWSVGRPDYVQYAGSLTLPDTENVPGPNNFISVNNAGIKAWSARTTKVSLEYYFPQVGLVQVAAFRRDIKNFFGTTRFRPTAEFLGLYGLDPAIYGDYEVSTQYNLSTPAQMSGVDLNYKQALTFLPHWARGVQVYANASALTATGDDSNSFQGYVPRTVAWGVSLSRPRYNLQVKWNYNSPRRQAPVTAGRSIEPGSYTWGAKRLLIDVIGEYYFYKRIAVFANLNNVADTPSDLKIYGPSTPAYATFRQRQNFGSLWTFGVRGSF
jgi:TonB-dependent receptor